MPVSWDTNKNHIFCGHIFFFHIQNARLRTCWVHIPCLKPYIFEYLKIRSFEHWTSKTDPPNAIDLPGTPKSHAAERPPAAARESHTGKALLATEPTAPGWHLAPGWFGWFGFHQKGDLWVNQKAFFGVNKTVELDGFCMILPCSSNIAADLDLEPYVTCKNGDLKTRRFAGFDQQSKGFRKGIQSRKKIKLWANSREHVTWQSPWQLLDWISKTARTINPIGIYTYFLLFIIIRHVWIWMICINKEKEDRTKHNLGWKNRFWGFRVQIWKWNHQTIRL